MSLDLYGNEGAIVGYLKSIGFTDDAASIYTAILCRQYRSPKDQLISALTYHLPGSRYAKSGETIVCDEIDRLVSIGLLRVVNGRSGDIIEAQSPWAEALKRQLPVDQDVDAEIALLVNDSLKVFAPSSSHERALIERLGWATWDKSRQSWRDAIQSSRKKIRIGVYSSITAYDEIKDDIYDALINHEKMNIQILMFSPQLAAKVEENPDLARDVRSRTQDWLQLFKRAKDAARERGNKPKLEVRHVIEPEMCGLHRVTLIDDRLWIFNIHRPGVERGIEGIVYQGRCEPGMPSNVFLVLEHYWDAAWGKAVAVHRFGRVLHYLNRERYLGIIISMPLLAWYLHRYHRESFLNISTDWWGGGAIALAISEIYNNSLTLVARVSDVFGVMSRVLRWVTLRK